MKNKKQKEKLMKIISPESSSDIEDIVEMLQEKESSIIVNMSKCKKIKQNVIAKIIDFILNNQTSYMAIKVKKIFPKVFVCWSEHIELYI